MARPAAALGKAVANQNRVYGAPGRNSNFAAKPSHQELANLARTPVRLLALQPYDQAFELRGELVGIADWPPRAIAQGSQSVLFVTIEDLVAGLTGYAEVAAYVRHGLPIQQAGDKPKALFLHRTRS